MIARFNPSNTIWILLRPNTVTSIEILSRRLDYPSSRLEIVSRRLDYPSSRLEIVSRRLDYPSSRLEILSRRLDYPSSRLEILSRRPVPCLKSFAVYSGNLTCSINKQKSRITQGEIVFTQYLPEQTHPGPSGHPSRAIKTKSR